MEIDVEFVKSNLKSDDEFEYRRNSNCEFILFKVKSLNEKNIRVLEAKSLSTSTLTYKWERMLRDLKDGNFKCDKLTGKLRTDKIDEIL